MYHQPELLSGTLRENLDPFQEHDDATLNDALRAAGLFSLQRERDEGKITLDSHIASGGGGVSVGQRQVLALARAIVRQSKLLILDEGKILPGRYRNLTHTRLINSHVSHRYGETGRFQHLTYSTEWPDYETDTVIQESLRDKLNKDVTLLTIAHRLQTIMDNDKIVSTLHARICIASHLL